MGGLLNILDIGGSALFASQAAMNTTSNNIANANTPGYDSEITLLEPVDYVSLAGGNANMNNPGGVAVTGVQRQYDSFLQNQIYQQQQSLSSSDSSSNVLSQVEQAFNETGNTGLSTYFNNFVDSWQQVADNPSDAASRTVLLSNAQALVGAAQQAQGAVQSAIKWANDSIAQTVQTVNNLASQIAGLNQKISSMAGTGDGSDSQLRDERTSVMNQLSQYVDFNYFEDPTGQVTIIAGMQDLVSGSQTEALSVQPDSNGDNQVYMGGRNITSVIQKGSLGGLIAGRSDAETQGLDPLRRFVAALVQQVNQVQEQGYDLNGNQAANEPFFTPLTLDATANSGASITASVTNESQLTLDEYNITYSGGSYSVTDRNTGQSVTASVSTSGGSTTIGFDGIQAVISGAPNSGDTFSISPLESAVNNFGVAITGGSQVAAAQTAGEPGDNSNALAMLNMLQNGQVPGLGNDTLTDYYKGIVSTTGALSSAASDSQTFNSNLLDQLNAQRDSTSGVSLDEETVNLIKYQQAYEAGAKVIETTSQLINTLMNI
ncbi:MAG: flagellar hook-associated protein FlgK [Nitrospiraceae bacterium]|nr:flagellar hook-associated protein FlgK [Nitrospiraceae bacterium]